VAERNGRRLNAFLAEDRAATPAARARDATPAPLSHPWRFDESGIDLQI